MAKDIKAALANSRDTLLQDIVGAVSLVVILFGGLALPGLF